MSFSIRRLRLAVLPVACVAALPSFSQTPLKEVVVTANRTEQLLQTAPIGATVILGDDIRAAGVLDANEAVRRLGGVAARSDLGGGREYSLDLRGYGEASTQNLVVVIDGVRISENELASARLSAIAPDMIERIEILRGGASVMWGEGASGGVIQVVTRRGAAPGLHGSAALGVESAGGHDTQAALDVGGEHAAFNARLRRYVSQGWRDNGGHDQNVASLGLQLFSAGFKASLGLQHEGQNARFPGSLTFAQYAANPRQSVKPQDHGDLSDDRISGALQYQTGPWLLALDLAGHDRSSRASFVSTGYQSDATSSNSQFSPRLAYQTDWGGSAVNAVLGHDSLQWSAHYLNNFGGDEHANQTNGAWYGKLDVLLPSQTRLAAGLRRETVKKSANDPANFLGYAYQDALHAWDLAVNQTLAPGWDAYARTARSYRLANVDENRYALAQLRPMLARDAEAGLKYLRGGSSAALRLFSQRSVDEIAYDPTVGPFGANVNQDAIRRRGLELEGRSALDSAWDAGGSLQAIRAVFSAGPNVGKRVPLVPRLTATARVGYTFAVRQRLEWAVRHRSQAVLGSDSANTCTQQVPAATLFDARYTYAQAQPGGVGWTLSAGLDNLTDRKTYSNAFVGFAGCAASGVYPEAGRVLKLSARYSF